MRSSMPSPQAILRPQEFGRRRSCRVLPTAPPSLRFEVTEDSGHAASVDQPHRRFNALTGDSVFVSPHRTERPWGGKQERVGVSAPSPAYDPGCYLCPGNTRANGERNPDYRDTYVFINDFAALLPGLPGATAGLN